METLHRLAGMTETSDPNTQPSQPVPEPPPIPPDSDGETAGGQTSSPHLSQRASRASLPLNRQPSHKSFHSSKNNRSRRTSLSKEDANNKLVNGGGGGHPPLPTSNPQTPRTAGRPSHESDSDVDEDEDNDEFVWGPSHPCFPHPNPHCAPSSPEATSTRVIRVRRDWLLAGDLYPQYANLYPEILDPLVSDEDFRFLISNINARLKEAFDPFGKRAWIDSAMGVLTGFLWDDFGLAGSKRGIKGLEGFIDEWNKGKEVRVVQLRRTGFMALDFVVPDPGIDGVGEGGIGGGGEEGGIGPAE